MNSVKEFFEFRSSTFCGIPAVEMKGTKADWLNLKTKFVALKETLQNISEKVGLNTSPSDYNYSYYDEETPTWWEKVEIILDKLIDTYNGNPDSDWWARIINESKYGSGSPTFTGKIIYHFSSVYRI